MVTGAAKGIGRAIVERLIREDYYVVALDINAAGGQELEAALGKENLQFEAVDVCNQSRAWLGNRGQSNYSASKAGVVGMTRALALELGKYNVSVNAVAPGLIDTALTRNLGLAVLQKLIEAQPTRTMGKPEDVANLVAF